MAGKINLFYLGLSVHNRSISQVIVELDSDLQEDGTFKLLFFTSIFFLLYSMLFFYFSFIFASFSMKHLEILGIVTKFCPLADLGIQ